MKTRVPHLNPWRNRRTEEYLPGKPCFRTKASWMGVPESLLQPGADVLLVGGDKRCLMVLSWLAAYDSRNSGIIGEGTVGGEPALGEGDCSHL